MQRSLRKYLILVAVAVVTMLVVACSGDDDDDTVAGPARTATTSTTTATTQSTADSQSADSYSGASTADSDDAGSPSTQSTAVPAPTSTVVQQRQAASSSATQPAAPAPAGRQDTPSATTFKDYGRTSFVDASQDAVSTFSLDTDRTSYFLALNWALNGYEVDPDSVRAEEWINAFAYGYDLPRDGRSFAMRSDVVGHPLDGGLHIARVALQAPTVPDDSPLNVTLVLDASGSMANGNRVDIARTAAETIRQSLRPRDRIAVVHFTTDVLDRYTVEHTGPDDRDVVRSIEQLAPHNSTNVQAGLNLGVRLADQARRERPDAFNYVILMSDGVANVDATNPFSILETARDVDHLNPLRLITVGVGIENYNDYLLEQLAQHGNGWYRYLDDTSQARSTFSRENWLALSTPFADQARAQVTWDPRLVQAWRIVGYENRVTPDHTFEQNRKEFAELPSGAATTVFYELALHNEARNRQVSLGEVEVRWVDPRTGETLGQRLDVAGHTAAPFDSADRFLRLGAIVALSADRYSALSPQVEYAAVDTRGVHADLEALEWELSLLDERLGATQAYDDFRLLLNHLTVAAAQQAPSTGYSQ
jgi:Ca-activated chloride channel family protein